MKPPISLYWPVSNNFGDLIGKYILEKITGRRVQYAEAHTEYSRYIIGGSVLNHAGPGAIVWGAGLGTITDGVNPYLKINAVRGPISRARALSCDATCPPIYGDPGILLPWFYKPTSKRDKEVGIVPHYVDQFRAYDRYKDAFVIDVFNPIEQVIEDINSCKLIVSSSLHGLIVANAYGIPAVWVQISDSIGGDKTKYRDYYESVGMHIAKPIDLRESCNLPDLVGVLPQLNTSEFWSACPIPMDDRKPEYR